MKSAIVALCIFACAYAVSDKDAQVQALTYESQPDGSYFLAYKTENDIEGQAEGKVKVFGKDDVALEVTGSNQYISPEGELIKTVYVANENGYQPQGNHLPTTPAPVPIPDYIVRSLEYIKAHPYTEKN